jgi:hypothetical protein
MWVVDYLVVVQLGKRLSCPTTRRLKESFSAACQVSNAKKYISLNKRQFSLLSKTRSILRVEQIHEKVGFATADFLIFIRHTLGIGGRRSSIGRGNGMEGRVSLTPKNFNEASELSCFLLLFLRIELFIILKKRTKIVYILI